MVPAETGMKLSVAFLICACTHILSHAKELFHVFFLPDHQNSSHRKHTAGAFLDFLSVRILKLCSMYFDFQKIDWKKSKPALSERQRHFLGPHFVAIW